MFWFKKKKPAPKPKPKSLPASTSQKKKTVKREETKKILTAEGWKRRRLRATQKRKTSPGR